MAFPSITYTLTNGTTSDASQVMQNFNDLINGLSDTTKDISVSNGTFAGTLTASGNVVLGASSTQTLTVNAKLSSSIPIAANTTYNVGSATLGLLSVYIGGTSTFTTRIMSAATATYTLTLPATAGSANQVPVTDGSGALSFVTLQGNSTVFKAPTIQSFTSTGSQTGWLFNVTAWVGTIVAGDTYTNNGHTYTALATTQTNGTGQTLWMSGASALSGTTLTKAVSASGPATMTFTNTGSNALNPISIGTYTTPTGPTPVYLRIRMAGGGGGGGSEGASPSSGPNGVSSAFGPLLILCNGGVNGLGVTNGTTQGGLGGSASITSPAAGVAITGGQGGGNGASSTGVGPMGGANPFGGGGSGGSGSNPGVAGATNTGAGGGGGGGVSGSLFTGPGGGAGGYAEAFLSSPGATYYYCVGTGGAGSTSTGQTGGAGAAGIIFVEEFYQ